MDFDVKMNGSPPAGVPLQGFTNDTKDAGGVWTGMTIKDILEKVDLFNITTDDGDEPSGKDVKPNISSKNSFKVSVSFLLENSPAKLSEKLPFVKVLPTNFWQLLSSTNSVNYLHIILSSITSLVQFI